MKRGQSAIEFMILVGFLMLSFVIFVAVMNSNMSDKIRERQNQRLYDVASTVKSEIDLAYGSINGYSRSFDLPPNLGGLDYQVVIDGGLVAVKTVGGEYSLALPVKNVTGEVWTGTNLIQKENGAVELNPS